MDKKMKEFLQQKMDEETEQVLEIVNSDPGLADIELPEELHDKLFARIRAYEKEKAEDHLSEEQRELIRLGTVYKKKRKRTKYYVLAAALIAAMAFGMTSIGGSEKIVELLKRTIAGREQIRVNTGDEKIDPVEVDSEEEAYQEIEEQFGFKPVRLYYIPDGISFKKLITDDITQTIQLIYKQEKECPLLYQISTGYRKGSQGIDMEDQLVEKYEIQIGQVCILIRNYVVEEDNINQLVATFEYKNVQYILTGNEITKQEFEKILKNLYFF